MSIRSNRPFDGNLGVRDGAYRLVPEELMLDELILFCWPHRHRAGDPRVRELAQRTLARWVDEGLPYARSSGLRRFDKCEVHNFYRARRDPAWTDNVEAHRLLVDELAGVPTPSARFDVELERSINLAAARGDNARRFGMLLPMDDATQTLRSVDVVDVPGVNVVRSPGLLEARVARGDLRERVRLQLLLGIDLRPRTRTELGTEPEMLYLSRSEGPIQVTPFIEELARSLVEGVPSPLERLKRFWRFFFERMKVGYVHHDFDADDPLRSMLELEWADCYAGSALLVGLCRAVGIPARLVSGVLVYPTAPGTHYWLEAWMPDGWFPLDLACWNLSMGDLADERWSMRFFGRLDHRITLEHHPRRRIASIGCEFPRRWYRVERPSARGTEIAYYDQATERLAYSDVITVKDWHPIPDGEGRGA